jgi:hypothetical protein
MKPGELERQLSRLGEVARAAQARLAEVAREVGELRGIVESSAPPAAPQAAQPDRSGAGAFK